MIYIGIDPGLHGAVGVICTEFDGHTTVSVFDTPIAEVEGKNKYNVAGMAQILKGYGTNDVLVVLEAVHSMPSQGVSSSFCFGEGLGMWKGIIATLGMPLEMVSPQRWKKVMMADTGKDKNASRIKASQIFPSLAEQLNRMKDDGRAEALLMADYGRRLRKG